MPQPNGRLQLMLTGDPNCKVLQITDPVSHVMIAEVKLAPEALAQLLSTQLTGSVEGVPAFIAPDLNRIGQEMAFVTIILRTTYDRIGDPYRESLATWAEMAKKRVNAYSVSVTLRREGRTAVRFVSYHPTSDLAEQWEKEAQFVLDELKGHAPGGDE